MEGRLVNGVRHVIPCFICIVFIGCASGRERQALRDYRGLEPLTYGKPSRPSSRPQLPLLTVESTLQDYLRYAELNNPGLEAAFNRWKAALEKIPQARSLPDPRVNYGGYVKESQMRMRQRVGGAQEIPWPDKIRVQAGMAMEEADAARKRYEAERLKLFYEVKDAYYEYYYINRATEITRENRELLKFFEDIARTKYRVGTAAHPDVIKAQVELGKMDDSLRSLQDLMRPAVSKLNAALNRRAELPLPAPRSIPGERIELSEERLIAWLKEANPELAALRYDVERERRAIRLAREGPIPDIMFGFDWEDFRPMEGENRGIDGLMASASVNIPIWYTRYKAAIREAEARYIAAERERIGKENTLAYDLALAYYRYRDAERKIDLYGRTLVPKAEESLRASETAYRAGNMDFLNLIDAQRILLEFRLSYERALADRAQRFAELEMLVGREAPAGEMATEGGEAVEVTD